MFGRKNKKVVRREALGASYQSRSVAARRSPSSRIHSRLAPRASRLPSSRRGVLLLVVLSLLVLFLMIGTAFVIVAKQSEQTAKVLNRAAHSSANDSAHGRLLDEVLLQLVRDTNNPASSLRFHSLLADMYGNDGWTSEIPLGSTPTNPVLISDLLLPLETPLHTGVTPANTQTPEFTVRWADNGLTGAARQLDVTHRQILEFDLVKFEDLHHELHTPYPATPLPPQYRPKPHPPRDFASIDDAYAGQLVTFTTGPARGTSTRIIGSRFTPASNGNWLTLRVLAFAGRDGSELPATEAELTEALAGSRILVNGRPFNGTGVGFNPSVNLADVTKAKLTTTDPVMAVLDGLPPVASPPVALAPNGPFFGASAGPKDITPPLLPLEQVADNYFLTPAELTDIAAWANNDVVKERIAKSLMKSRVGLAGRGGADETYDAPDYQNLILSFLNDEPDDSEWEEFFASAPGTWTDPNDPTMKAPIDLDEIVVPSFHRPALVNFSANPLAAPDNDVRQSELALPANVALLRKILLRPNWYDHPLFTGTNPNLSAAYAALRKAMDDGNAAEVQAQAGQLLAHMIYGPWDVDNDNDGARDSVWIDFGAPVMVGPEGKLVKPLAAVLCIDLDGRVNVNLHGTLDMAAFGDPENPNDDEWDFSKFREAPRRRQVASEFPLTPDPNADEEWTDELPHGMGASPADIKVSSTIGDRDFRALVRGDTIDGVFWPGRYGFDNSPGRNGMDAMSWINMYDRADRVDQRSNFASPVDLNARYSYGLNNFGQLVMEAEEIALNAPMATGSLRVDAPGEMNVAIEGLRGMDRGAADMPFSLGELERALRMYDADARELPARLYHLAALEREPENRLRITTDSVDVPVPNVSLPLSLKANVAPGNLPPRSVSELLDLRVRQALFPLEYNDDGTVKTSTPQEHLDARFPTPLREDLNQNGEVDAVEIRGIVRQLIAPELAAGLRLNVNRPLGNGRDDQADPNGQPINVQTPGVGYRVVDEPGEDLGATPQPQKLWAGNNNPGFSAADFTPLDADDNGKIDAADSWLQRQLLARHLYVMALTTSAPATFAAEGDLTDEDKDLARRLAQWAVNAVDFRDPDNIMTPFEYDVNPFDGWNVDGWLGNQRPGADGQFGTRDDVPLADSNPEPNKPDNDKPYRAVAWGAERPEMLITENMAWHDRRTTDEADEEVDADEPDGQTESGATYDELTKKDGSYDQLRRPRGAFFVELYNPWPASPGANSDIHALTTDGNDLGVDLAAVSVDPDGTGPLLPSPVWRLSIYKPRPPEPLNEDDDEDRLTLSFVDPNDPEADPNAAGGPNADADDEHPAAEIVSSAYFTGFGPKFGAADGATFYNNGPDLSRPQQQAAAAGQTPAVRSVRPGRYLVIGTGDDPDPDDQDLVFESPLGDPTDDDLTPQQLRQRQRRVVLEPGQFAAGGRFPFRMEKGNTIEASVPNDPQPVDNRGWMTDVAVINRALDERTEEPHPDPRRFTLSEPRDGYPDRFQNAVWQEPTDPQDDPEGKYVNGESEQEEPLDIPFDDNPEIRDDLDGKPLNIGFHASFKQVTLERLANPLLPWNPDPGPDLNNPHNMYNPNLPVNPYLAVDSSAANLTVFNGKNRGEPKSAAEGEEVANDEQPDTTDNPEDGSEDGQRSDVPAYFASLERGWSYQEDARRNRPDQAKLWLTVEGGRRAANVRDMQRNRAKYTDNSQFFKMIPVFTMGYLNSSFDARRSAFNNEPQLRIPNIPDTDNPDDPSDADEAPFPWMAWNNRPYVSGHELLLVPPWRSSQLLRQFSGRIDDDLADDYDTEESATQYETPVAPVDEARRENLQDNQNADDPPPEFGHLENFFYDPKPDESPEGVPIGLYRLLDMVQTPSLFAGTQTWLNPVDFGGKPFQGRTVTPVTNSADVRFNRQPPFNTISEYREPGRINLNTIYTRTVYGALFHSEDDDVRDVEAEGEDENPFVFPGADIDDGFNVARRGFAAGQDEFLKLSKDSPTLFNNFFRSPDAFDLLPLDAIVPPSPFSPVDCTLLRRDPQDPESPLFAARTDEIYNDARRNPYFRYQPMIRLSNMVTTRSNVYAIWVTVGFFEVEELQDEGPPYVQRILDRFADKPDATLAEAQLNPLFARVYPDGVLVGKEVGAEEGDQRRLRGFYVIDRTLPAGFKPGENTNVENVIRLKRRIE